MRKLTAQSVKTLKCRHPGGTWYADSALPGFVTVEEAREAARRILARAELGEDTVEVREKAAAKVRAAVTFKAWSAVYLSRRLGRRIRLKDTARYIALAVERWGGRRLDSITRADVENLYQEIGAEHAASAN